MRGHSKCEIRNAMFEWLSLAGQAHRIITAQDWPAGPSEISQPRSGWICGMKICPGGTPEVSAVAPRQNVFPRTLPATAWLANFHRRFATQIGGAS